MNELLQLIQGDSLIVKIVVFFFCGLIGMIVAYSQRWARGETGISWWQYMTGDTQATASSLIKLLAA